ncbi:MULTISPECIES: pirin family protein [unclassified Arcicella]|uniref:pirin family protein n=1 Tax=unclassified Arcicella TaxID=2644986 RepID=UPI00285A8642|nr:MULTISPECIES: pirin family protein [unclassified Arcicella]MDR6563224.1 redox-sensitive bicupin YhaK (pirin superfamily) [Arcicella sp. BE51]MDR6811625.1 redox-sensitive bicupin YhaK (pirin superfamily) [Arcicella sp. BE140]MDR6823151.1 redox-sensitive bicupin YhaK (pirin superfamily) [Arcicella sp. BE139]
MSNIKLIIEERPSNIGNFMVGRLLPFREKRMVGPFCFIDHMGPAQLSDHENLDVGPHPHIGLSTLTYLFEGSVMHKDSLGTEMEIKPNQVNWMTAGNGIVHSERTPEYLLHSDKTLHGLQIWVALPKGLEQMQPSFAHVTEEEIPTWETDGIAFKLIAGEAFGKKSAVPVYSPLYFIEIKNTSPQTVNIGNDLFGESALYILEGSISSEGHTYEPKHILIANDSKLCSFEMAENTTVYIFGGEPFPEERFIYWNFVASTKELIEDAKTRWIEQSFPKVPGETTFVPLPQPYRK